VPQLLVRGLKDLAGQHRRLAVMVFEERQPQGERVQAGAVGCLRPDLTWLQPVHRRAAGLAIPGDRHVERVRRGGRELGRVDVQPVPGRAQCLRPAGSRPGGLPA